MSSQKPIAYNVCRAAGLMNWVVECVYSDGRALLDLDSQSRSWQGGIRLASALRRSHGAHSAPIKVSADKYWTRRRTQHYLTSFCNFCHDLKDGKPIAHECYVLNVKLLKLESEGIIDHALGSIVAEPRTVHRGKRA